MRDVLKQRKKRIKIKTEKKKLRAMFRRLLTAIG